MSKVRLQVLGYRDFVSKQNRALTVITVASDCTSVDNAQGRYGVKVSDMFLPDDYVGTLTPDCLGMEFVPEYEINGFGKPDLAGFELRPWKN